MVKTSPLCPPADIVSLRLTGDLRLHPQHPMRALPPLGHGHVGQRLLSLHHPPSRVPPQRQHLRGGQSLRCILREILLLTGGTYGGILSICVAIFSQCLHQSRSNLFPPGEEMGGLGGDGHVMVRWCVRP